MRTTAATTATRRCCSLKMWQSKKHFVWAAMWVVKLNLYFVARGALQCEPILNNYNAFKYWLWVGTFFFLIIWTTHYWNNLQFHVCHCFHKSRSMNGRKTEMIFIFLLTICKSLKRGTLTTSKIAIITHLNRLCRISIM